MNESSYFQLLSNCFCLIMPGVKSRESSFPTISIVPCQHGVLPRPDCNELSQARSAGDRLLTQRYAAPLRVGKEKIQVSSVSTALIRWLEESDYDLVVCLMKEIDVLAKYLSLVFDYHQLQERKKTKHKTEHQTPKSTNQKTPKP